jgi:hypothetical protein
MRSSVDFAIRALLLRSENFHRAFDEARRCSCDKGSFAGPSGSKRTWAVADGTASKMMMISDPQSLRSVARVKLTS